MATKRIEYIIEALENSKLELHHYFLSFIFIIGVRNLLEIFSDSEVTISTFRYIHYYLFYFSLCFAITILLHMSTRVNIDKVLRITLVSFVMLIIAPLVDLALSRGAGYDMTYLSPGHHDPIWGRFIKFFGSYESFGITPGIRLEVTLALIGIFIYSHIKTLSIVRSIATVLAAYTIIFWHCAFPYIVKFIVEFCGSTFDFSDVLMINFLTISVIILGGVLAYLYNPPLVKHIIMDIRPYRLAHYTGMFILGIIIAGRFQKMPGPAETISKFFLPLVCIALVWKHAVMTNNIADYRIDAISSPQRHRIFNIISVTKYNRLAWVLLGLALAIAALADMTVSVQLVTNLDHAPAPGLFTFHTTFIMILFAGNYALYSLPPIRFKRVPFISKLAISLNSLVLILLGFLAVKDSLVEFSAGFTIAMLIGLTAAVNFIDLKDVEGDMRAGIRTLPVILGFKKAQRIIGLFIFMVYCFSGFLVEGLWIRIVMPIFGIIQFTLITRSNYSEKPVFRIYLLSLILFMAYFYISKYVTGQ